MDKAQEKGKYRYWLERSIQPGWAKTVCFVMLNPSTACDSENDPTIRRCISFAKREGATKMNVVNLYAYRATHPKNLNRLPLEEIEGPENVDNITEAMLGSDLVICAWGGNALPAGSQAFQEAWKLAGKLELYCLGTCKNGSPRHPLMLSGDTRLERYNLEQYL